MIRSLCPFCAAAKSLNPQWPSHRAASTLQKRRPSRMDLSPNVSRGPPKTTESGQRPIRKSRANSPFGGMNVTEPPRPGYGVKRGVSISEQKRAGGKYGSKDKKGEEPKGEMKALKMQRALSSISYEARARVKQTLADLESFGDFDLLPVIKESVSTQALGGLSEVSPTPIQRLAIPALLGTEDGKHRNKKANTTDGDSAKKAIQYFLLAAETGSGKTLAYTLPILDALKRAEATALSLQHTLAAEKAAEIPANRQLFELPSPPLHDDSLTNVARPSTIILLPTSELVAQVGALLKNLSHSIKFKSAMLSTAYTSTVIRSRLFAPGGVDIVVSTPHLLSSITESDPNVLSRVKWLVIDEADSLLDRSFSPITSGIIDRVTPSLQQLVLCSATIPRSLDSYLAKRFPEVRRLVTPNLHAVPRRVQLSVVDIEKVPYQGNRDLACAQTIVEIAKENGEGGEGESVGGGKKVLVFVNEREKAAELTGFLRGKGIDATALSRDSDDRAHADVLAEFTGQAIPSANKPHTSPPPPSRRSGLEALTAPPIPRQVKGVKVLVMTDLGSRGIDTTLVKHVVLYDVPHTSIDFLHRLGRVGRMGRRGRAVVLVGKGDRRDVVREVREGMFKGSALI
ncbi:RNA helicase [Elasticomyces elasticus]|nr:RNA helicase [Elasticomyces elasticus]KAK3657725.1 RNA helicase [Elasticomyces elasticus]KAK4922530.1 RNA helicase [Elasticomyces elasticus]KAK5760617.1 RNA helicase [Elasticomyces elasticus]